MLGYYKPYVEYLRSLKEKGYSFRLVRDTAKKELHLAVFDENRKKKFHWELPSLMDDALLRRELSIPYLQVTHMNDHELWDKEIK